MKSFFVLLALIFSFDFSLSSPAVAFANDTASISFQQGNAAYSRGDYDEAIRIFEKIISTHGFSASLLYNLGNSYAQRNRIGKAILSYERARILAPGDPDITGNLQYIRKAHGIFEAEPSLASRCISRLTLDGWSILAAVFFTLICISLTVALLRKKNEQKRWILIALGCLMLLVFSAVAIIISYTSRQVFIVTMPKARIYLSPFPTAASIGSLQEGKRLKATKSHADYIYVTDETGRSGWIPQSAIEAIILQTDSQ